MGVFVNRRTRAFTLIELMVVVSIIAILASLGIPFLYRAVMRSRMAEAPPMLSAIRSNEISYFGRNDEFVEALPAPDDNPLPTKRPWDEPAPRALESIGFRPEGTFYFSYTVTINVDANTFSIGAKGDLDGDATYQHWGYQWPNAAGDIAPAPWLKTIINEKDISLLTTHEIF